MAAAEAAASLTADGVYLVYEYYGRGGLLRLLKQIAHAPRADADVKLHKIGAGDGEELHVRLARDGLCKQGLTCSRRADEQHALGDARTHAGVRPGILEEIDYLRKLLLLLVAAGNVGEGLFVLFIAAELRAGLTELADAALHPAGLVHHHIPQRHGGDHDDQIRQEACPPRDLDALAVIVLLQHTGFILLADGLVEVLIENGKAVQVIRLFLYGLDGVTCADAENDGVALRLERLHLLLIEKIDKLGIILYLVGAAVLCHGEYDCDENDHQQHIKPQISCSVAVGFQKTVTSLLKGLSKI